VLGEVALADLPAYATNAARLTNRVQLEEHVTQRFAALPVVEVVARLDRGGIANAVVNEVPAVAEHPQLAARGRWTTVSTPVGEVPALLPPHNLASVVPVMGRVPGLGEDTERFAPRAAPPPDAA
jgi:itaconate CoA-transferase